MTQKEIDLIKVQVDILKLKADDYTWQCHVPDDAKKMLEDTLVKVNEALGVS